VPFTGGAGAVGVATRFIGDLIRRACPSLLLALSALASPPPAQVGILEIVGRPLDL
jgi:hypothetical protein